ncbi:MAG: hypothetical protein PVF58_22550 [Candidatus Methanofastidiosia archaeon]|jgi:hypothetical protein
MKSLGNSESDTASDPEDKKIEQNENQEQNKNEKRGGWGAPG